MAVITSDSDLDPLVPIRLIGSHASCMQFGCRAALYFIYGKQAALDSLTPVNIGSCRQPYRAPVPPSTVGNPRRPKN